MFEEAIFGNVWIALPSVALLMVADYYLSLLQMLYWRRGAAEHVVVEGSYELTPEGREDMERLRLLSPTLIRKLLLVCGCIAFVGLVDPGGPLGKLLLRFGAGGLVLHYAVVNARHAVNLVELVPASAHRGIRGQVTRSKWYSYRASAADILSYAGVLGLAFLLTGSVPCLGGALITTGVGLRHWRISRKEGRKARHGPTEPERSNGAPETNEASA
jgi:hypothetical protein